MTASDAAHLVCEVACHRIGVFYELLPDATCTLDLSLAAELALGAGLARATRVTSPAKAFSWSTIHVDGVLGLRDLATDVDGSLLGEIAVGDRRGHVGNVVNLASKIMAPGFTLSVKVFQAPPPCHLPGRRACPRLPRPRSHACDFPGDAFSWSTIRLMVRF